MLRRRADDLPRGEPGDCAGDLGFSFLMRSGLASSMSSGLASAMSLGLAGGVSVDHGLSKLKTAASSDTPGFSFK